MPPAGFEATIPATERPQTHTLDRVATRIGWAFITAELSLIPCQTMLRHVKVVSSGKFLNKIPLNSGY